VLEDEIATGLAAVRRFGAGGSHCLCHGAFGNLAPLIRDGHVEEANSLARRAVEEYRSEGRWRCGIASYAPTPGLMSGLAGIGMGLLSMAAPSTLDILTLEL
jgi:lantibiotic modifying enzyme